MSKFDRQEKISKIILNNKKKKLYPLFQRSQNFEYTENIKISYWTEEIDYEF